MRNAIKLGILCLVLASCQKEINHDGGNEATPGCNQNIKRLNRWQSTVSNDNYIESVWNADGTVQSLRFNVPFSYYRTANFVYNNGRITEAIIKDNSSGVVEDTAVFHYNAAGLVDSMYLKNSNYFDYILTYNSNNHLTKLSRVNPSGGLMYYWDIQTDAHGNVTKGVEYWNQSTGPEKLSTFTFSRDQKKNPLSGLFPFMLYLEKEYNILSNWGPNNLIDQVYEDHTGSGVVLTTGYVYTYNADCYPIGSRVTLNGFPLFPDDDYTFSYY